MSSENLSILQRVVEQRTGLSADYIRDTPLSDHQERIQARDGQLNVCTTGKVGMILTTKEIDQMLDKALEGN